MDPWPAVHAFVPVIDATGLRGRQPHRLMPNVGPERSAARMWRPERGWCWFVLGYAQLLLHLQVQ